MGEVGRWGMAMAMGVDESGDADRGIRHHSGVAVVGESRKRDDHREAVVIHPHWAGVLAAGAAGRGAIAGHCSRHSTGGHPARAIRSGATTVWSFCGVSGWRMVTRATETPTVNAVPANGFGGDRR